MKRILLIILTTIVLTACREKDDSGPDNTPSSANSDGLHVVDRQYLADRTGNKLTLIGLNLGSLWADGLGIDELNDIDKTGANAVRFMLNRQTDNSNPVPVTAAQVEPLINYCVRRNIIPVLSLHDFTGSNNVSQSLGEAVDWWSNGDMQPMLMKYQKSLIINIANEPSDENTDADAYTAATIRAVKQMRRAGFSCPLMIDANNWGHDATYFTKAGNELMDADPLHNLVLSLHAWWTTNGGTGAYSVTDVSGFIRNLANTGLPVVVGELGWGLERDGTDFSNPANYDHIPYQAVLAACRQYQTGYLAWQWGFIAPEGSRNAGCISSDGTYGGLTSVGKQFVVSDPYAIKDARRAKIN